MQSLKQVFGEVGGLSVDFDLLRFDVTENLSGSRAVAILRVPAENSFKLRTALTLIAEFQGHACRFNVECASPFLLSLLRTDPTWTTGQDVVVL